MRVRWALTIGFVILLWTPIRAAFPTIIMIYGAPLERPVFVTPDADLSSVVRFAVLYDDHAASPLVEADLANRPFVKVAVFWGGAWMKYLEDRAQLPALRPEEATQHGRLYPPTATQPAVAVMTPIFFGSSCANSARDRRLPSGVRDAKPVPTDVKDFACAAKLSVSDSKAAHELGIPGF